MARKRMLHPEFFTSETVASVSRDARLTFAGLWVYADDKGRGKDVAALVKAAVWPLDDDVTRHDVEGHLVELAGAGLICRYTDDDAPLLHVVKWDEHQRISHPTPSKLAGCPHCERRCGGDPEPLGSTSGTAPEPRGETLHSVVKGSSVQVSAAAAQGPPLPSISDDERAALASLAKAITAAGLSVSWALTEPDLRRLLTALDRSGVRALVDHAKRRHQPGNPAHSVKAWLEGWEHLPTLALVEGSKAKDCPAHPSAARRPDGECGACRTDRLVAAREAAEEQAATT